MPGREGTRPALGLRMHPMAFVQKRGHLSAVARGRKMFARVPDMTPARFDILYLIHEQRIDAVSGVRSTWMMQADIPHLLGLTRQTVWQAVERLVELGLLTKQKGAAGPERRRNILMLTEEGFRRIRRAMGVAFSEQLPLPSDAPIGSGEEVPRYWRRRELADVRRNLVGDVVPPKKVGREVAKVYSAFAWKMVGPKSPKRRHRYLQTLDDMIMNGIELAAALGDRSTMIYPVWEPYFTGLPQSVHASERRTDGGRDKRWCEVRDHILLRPRRRSVPVLETAPTTTRCRPRRPPHRYRKCRRLPDSIRAHLAVEPAAIARSA